MITDFHTHAFPDEVAAKAIPHLEKSGNVTACTAGTTDALLRSMNRAGIERSVICSIATKPEQFDPILSWSISIRSPRLLPLLSIHPDDPARIERVWMVAENGFAGIKMHPFYQGYHLAEERLDSFYEALVESNLLLVAHCGFDIGFPPLRCADPAQIVKLLEKFPKLRLVTTHFGGWKLWDEVEETLIGREIYMEISFALRYLAEEQVKRMISKHPSDYLLFGSDSPWEDQKECLKMLESLSLGSELFTKITETNARQLI